MKGEDVIEILKPFLETMLERDLQDREFRRDQQLEENNKYEKLANTVNDLGSRMGELVTIIKVQEQKHAQTDKDNDRINSTQQNQGKRLYSVETELIGMKNDIKNNSKPWVKLDRISTIFIAGLMLAASVYFFKFR